MNKALRIIIVVLAILFLFVSYLSRFGSRAVDTSGIVRNFEREGGEQQTDKPEVAFIFDDLGESLMNIRQIYSLKIPVSVAIIPGLKFSKNIAYIAHRCGFSVLIHLPLEPKKESWYHTDKYTFISSSLSPRKIKTLLRFYLNYVRIAVGVNTHMGSRATEDSELMATVLKAIKEKDFVFIDSRTSLNSVAYDVAKAMGMRAGLNEGFVDAQDDREAMREKLRVLVERAYEREKIIIIAHPKKGTIELLKQELPALRRKVNFITIKEYFGL